MKIWYMNEPLLTDLVGKLGYYLPWSLGSAILMSIGNGFLCTISLSTPVREWVGYEILVGAGRGLGLQMPVIAVQNTLPPDTVSISMSLLSFSQTFGGAVFLTVGGTIFTNSLSVILPTYAPGVDPEAVIAAGGTGLRQLISNPKLLAGVLIAYGKAVDRVFYLALGCACATFLSSLGMGWNDIRKKEEPLLDGVEEKN
jgi:hypothetical protein